MATSHVIYEGQLRTRATHLASGIELITDAPVDNKGKGEAFSPTDLVATAYVSCMLTIMGIYCEEHQISFERAHAEVTKVMGSNPRHIARIEVSLDVSGNSWDERTLERVLAAGRACPVAKSLASHVELVLTVKS